MVIPFWNIFLLCIFSSFWLYICHRLYTFSHFLFPKLFPLKNKRHLKEYLNLNKKNGYTSSDKRLLRHSLRPLYHLLNVHYDSFYNEDFCQRTKMFFQGNIFSMAIITAIYNFLSVIFELQNHTKLLFLSFYIFDDMTSTQIHLLLRYKIFLPFLLFYSRVMTVCC